jgi:putative transposase
LLSSDRLFWVASSRVWAGWRQALVFVSPNTVLRWQRRRFREYWARLSARPAAGRPRVSRQIRALVVRMAQANPLWGAPRIHGELQMLGIDVAERTVSRLLPQRRSPPSQTWRTFLTNHVRDLVSIDFFTVPTARLRVLFVFVVLAHDRRRVLHFNVTEHPTAAWTAQQIVDAFPDDSAPSYLLRDRDAVYGPVFRQRVKGMGVGEVLTAPHRPNSRSVRTTQDRCDRRVFRRDTTADSTTSSHATEIAIPIHVVVIIVLRETNARPSSRARQSSACLIELRENP